MENDKKASDCTAKETRIDIRRRRVETRTAAKKDDTSKTKKTGIHMANNMGKGQAQIADSLNQLDRRKVRHICFFIT